MGNFYRHLAMFFWSHCWGNTLLSAWKVSIILRRLIVQEMSETGLREREREWNKFGKLWINQPMHNPLQDFKFSYLLYNLICWCGIGSPDCRFEGTDVSTELGMAWWKSWSLGSLTNFPGKQCDQMARLFFNISPFTTMRFAPKT